MSGFCVTDPEQPIPATTPDRFATTGPLVTILTIIAILIGVVVLAFAIRDEPLHIDELRQVKMYDRSFRTIALDAFEADQPPLDHWLNAIAQNVVGVGDTRQRILPAFWGFLTLLAVAWMARRKNLGIGVPIAVLFVGISPSLVALTPYARPYAIAILLMLVYLFATDVWLHNKSPWAASTLVLAALYLPWSRTADPLIILAAAIAVLLFRRFVLSIRDEGSVWLPIGAAAGAILFVGLPIISKLPQGGYSASPEASALPQLWERVPQAWMAAVPLFLVLVALAAVLVIRTGTRRHILEWWWVWALFALPIGFAIAFALTVNWPIQYLARYGFAWVIPFAFVLGLASVSAFRNLQRDRTAFVDILVAVSVVAVFAATTVTLVDRLTTRSAPDWDLMATEVESRVGPYTTILFHDVLSFGYNWTTFAAADRYLDGRYEVDSTMQIARNADNLHDRGPVVVVTFREPLDVPGWSRIQIDHQAWIYMPAGAVEGAGGVVETLLHFADHTDPWRGAGLTAAAASLVHARDSVEAGCEVLEDLAEEPGLHQAVLNYAEDYGGEMLWMTDCRP